MPANIEIKARVRDFEKFKHSASQLSEVPCQVIPQEDTFFTCPQGRIKLRQLSADRGQLIYYQRQDIKGPKHSDYRIVETDKPGDLKTILAQAFGVRGVVRKTRYLFIVGQTRIHLDEVVGLGTFMELEVVLRDDQTDVEGQRIAEGLMRELGVGPADLIDKAYMDLIEE